jgi:hypothetical protein
MPEPPKIPKTQAPIFRRPALTTSPSAGLPAERGPDQALVTPLGIFVARRKCFDAVVRDRAVPSLALEILFRELPLEALGWHIGAALVSRLGTSGDGFPIWRVNSTGSEPHDELL